MKHAKHLLAAVIPCVVASLCLLAMAAPAAQAEGNWKIEGKNLTEKVEIEGEIDKGPYSFLLPDLGFSLVFESFSIDNGVLSTEGKGTAELLFTKGKVIEEKSGKEVTSCKPGNLTFKVKSTLFLHGGKTYDLLQPAEGTVLTVTTYEEGCVLGAENFVTGAIVLEDAGGGFEAEAVKHLVQQAPDALFPGLTMKFGTHPVHLDGSWWMALKGKNSGKKWSGIA